MHDNWAERQIDGRRRTDKIICRHTSELTNRDGVGPILTVAGTSTALLSTFSFLTMLANGLAVSIMLWSLIWSAKSLMLIEGCERSRSGGSPVKRYDTETTTTTTTTTTTAAVAAVVLLPQASAGTTAASGTRGDGDCGCCGGGGLDRLCAAARKAIADHRTDSSRTGQRNGRTITGCVQRRHGGRWTTRLKRRRRWWRRRRRTASRATRRQHVHHRTTSTTYLGRPRDRLRRLSRQVRGEQRTSDDSG